MKKQTIQNFQIFLGIFLLLLGMSLYFVVSNPIRYLGIIFFAFSVLIFVALSFSKNKIPKRDKFKSPTRDQILKHQYKK